MVQYIFWGEALPKKKTMHDGTANKERQEGKCDRLRCCGMENSSWEGREGRGPGGKEKEEDAGADRNIDEGGEEEDGGERERKTGERRRGPEKREGTKKAEAEGRGNARGVGEKASRKGERREEEGEVTTTTAAIHENERKREEGQNRREEGR
jgi:hypothetical protein